MSVTLTINITDIEDAITLRNGLFVQAVFTHAAEVVNAGGRIIIQREYVNASPDHLATFSTSEDLENWKSRLEEILARLDGQQ